MMEWRDERQIHDLLYREAACLDEQRWDEWLALFTEDCEYWLAAWKSDHELVADPRTEVSMIHYDSRAGLEDRVLRIRGGASPAAMPLPRTWHQVGQIRIGEESAGLLPVHAQWQANVYRFGETDSFYGRYEYRLARAGAPAPSSGQWRIRWKKIVLVNDMISTGLDIYCI